MRAAILTVGTLALITFGAVLTPARAAESNAVQLSEAVSGPGLLAVVTGAVVLPLLADEGQGQAEALCTADAILSASIVTELLKRVVREPRPQGDYNDSFPSLHATAAFAAATMASDRHPAQAPYWYGAAALIAYSRVRLDLHHTQDVAAGALLGFGIARLEQELPRGLLIAPFYDPQGDGGGVQAVWNF